jgi:secreted PhoX family phosphatase
MKISRRDFVAGGAMAVSLGFGGLYTLFQRTGHASPPPEMLAEGFGPLLPDPTGVLDLPQGFTYRIISRVGDKMQDGLRVPGQADGMATFAGPDGLTILVRNHELSCDQYEKGAFGAKNELLATLPRGCFYDYGFGKTPSLGGTTTLWYDTKSGEVVNQFLSLAGSGRNCAGGPTPWGSWITCEETVQLADDQHERDHGYCFEVPSATRQCLIAPQPITGMGRFNHEAIAVDPASGIVYETEDRADGLLYRYLPERPGELLAGGRLQALALVDLPSFDTRNWEAHAGRIKPGQHFACRWIDLHDIASPKDDLRLRGFAEGAARFARGEGMWQASDGIYFACTNGGAAYKGQIWRYVPSPQEGTDREHEQPGQLTLFIEPNNGGLVDNADNITVAPWGDLVLCEDGSGEQFVVGVTPEGKIYKLARNAMARNSEFAGSCFSPDGTTLFVNIQSEGLTLAITGPWKTTA